MKHFQPYLEKSKNPQEGDSRSPEFSEEILDRFRDSVDTYVENQTQAARETQEAGGVAEPPSDRFLKKLDKQISGLNLEAGTRPENVTELVAVLGMQMSDEVTRADDDRTARNRYYELVTSVYDLTPISAENAQSFSARAGRELADLARRLPQELESREYIGEILTGLRSDVRKLRIGQEADIRERALDALQWSHELAREIHTMCLDAQPRKVSEYQQLSAAMALINREVAQLVAVGAHYDKLKAAAAEQESSKEPEKSSRRGREAGSRRAVVETPQGRQEAGEFSEREMEVMQLVLEQSNVALHTSLLPDMYGGSIAGAGFNSVRAGASSQDNRRTIESKGVQVDAQLLREMDSPRGETRVLQALADKFGIAEVITAEMAMEDVYEEEALPQSAWDRLRGKAPQTRSKKVGEKKRLHSQLAENGVDEPAVVVRYVVPVHRDREQFPYVDYSGRHGQTMDVRLELPQSTARALMTEVQKNPALMRTIVERIATEKVGITESGWNNPSNSNPLQQAFSSLKPPIEEWRKRNGSVNTYVGGLNEMQFDPARIQKGT